MRGIGKVKWSLYNVKCFLPGPSSLVKSSDLNYPDNLFRHSRIINQVGGYCLKELHNFCRRFSSRWEGRKVCSDCVVPAWRCWYQRFQCTLCNSLAKIKETKQGHTQCFPWPRDEHGGGDLWANGLMRCNAPNAARLIWMQRKLLKVFICLSFSLYFCLSLCLYFVCNFGRWIPFSVNSVAVILHYIVQLRSQQRDVRV